MSDDDFFKSTIQSAREQTAPMKTRGAMTTVRARANSSATKKVGSDDEWGDW